MDAQGLGKSPLEALEKVFRSLDRDAFESVLGEWVESQLGPGEEAIAMDDKTLRGIHGDEGIPGVRLVATYTHGQGLWWVREEF